MNITTSSLTTVRMARSTCVTSAKFNFQMVKALVATWAECTRANRTHINASLRFVRSAHSTGWCSGARSISTTSNMASVLLKSKQMIWNKPRKMNMVPKLLGWLCEGASQTAKLQRQRKGSWRSAQMRHLKYSIELLSVDGSKRFMLFWMRRLLP